jgi:rhomboid protease GluP
MNKSSSVPGHDLKETAESLRRQAIERLNHDFVSPETICQQPEQDQSIDEQALDQSPEIADESFFSSKRSQLGKARLWLWLGAALGVASSVFANKGGSGSLVFVLIIMLMIIVPLDWLFRRRLNIGKASVILNREAIESPVFSGKLKRYQWKDIVNVTLVSDQSGKRLRFEITESSGQPNKRNFWTGINYACPEISLALFEPQDQERLMEAVIQRLKRSRNNSSGTAQTLLNSLTEEREFQERLKSLAPTPWVTYAIIAINALVWVWTLVNGASILNTPAEKLLVWGGNAASEVQRGEWWRLVTATFLHSGMMHILMNMIGLVGAGITVERIYGHRLYCLIYLGSGLIGSALSLHFSAQHAVSVGASGAVFGVTGAMLVGVFQHRDKLPKAFGKQTVSSIGFFILYALMQGFTHKGIDNAAHIGGLIGGCLLAYVLPERFDMEHFVRTLKNRAVAGIALSILATVGLAAIAPTATIDQKRVFEGALAFQKGLAGFDSALKAIQKEHEAKQAGKISARELDERGRSIYSPMFKTVLQDLSQAYLSPTDPRLPILNETKLITEVLLELIEMPDVFTEGVAEPVPADPERAAFLEAKMKESLERLQKIMLDVKAKQKR